MGYMDVREIKLVNVFTYNNCIMCITIETSFLNSVVYGKSDSIQKMLRQTEFAPMKIL